MEKNKLNNPKEGMDNRSPLGDTDKLADDMSSTQDDATGNIRDKILGVRAKCRNPVSQNTLPSRSSARISDRNELNSAHDVDDSHSNARSVNRINRGNAVHRCLLFAQHTSALDIIETCVLKNIFPT